jgi:hypothetical protein
MPHTEEAMEDGHGGGQYPHKVTKEEGMKPTKTLGGEKA